MQLGITESMGKFSYMLKKVVHDYWEKHDYHSAQKIMQYSYD